ncbi:MAG: hypothetical protein NEA02_13000, partial [Thermoanaerobaculia bacterium]|nr:hypothetical protein [Thermoanaerobaculia bacterium]
LTNKGGAVGEKVTLSAKLKSNDPKVKIQGLEVKFLVDGKAACDDRTDAQGQVSCSWKVPNLTQGTKPLEARFAGNDTLAPGKATAQFLAAKAVTKLWIDGSHNNLNMKAKPGEKLELIAFLTRKHDDAPLEGRHLSFTVNKQNVGKSTTNGRGFATLHYRLPDDFAGDAHADAYFEGDDFNVASSDGNIFLVEHIKNGFLNVITADSGKTGEELHYWAQLTRNKPLPGIPFSDGIEGVKLKFLFDPGIGWIFTATTGPTGLAHAHGKVPQSANAVRVWVDPTSDWKAEEAIRPISVVPGPAKVTMSDSSGLLARPLTLKARAVRTNDGAPCAASRMNFELRGATIGHSFTNGAGDATLDITPSIGLGTGKHSIGAKADASGACGSDRASATLTMSAP